LVAPAEPLEKIGSQRQRATGLAEVDAHLSGTDSDAARVNTPPTMPFLYRLSLTATAPLSCELTIAKRVSRFGDGSEDRHEFG